MDQPAGTAWVVATGALTNVALLFATFPELVGHIKGLSIMGGAIGTSFTDAPMGYVKGDGERFGNHTRWAEFNIYVRVPLNSIKLFWFYSTNMITRKQCDPEAAESIFSHPELSLKATLIPLDVTHHVLATSGIQHNLLHGLIPSSSSSPSVTRLLFHEILTFFASTYSSVFGLTRGPPLHDPIAVAVLLDEKLFDDRGGERWKVKVVTDGLHSDVPTEQGQVGRTIVSPAGKGEDGVRIPRGVDGSRFWALVEDCMQRAEEAVATSNPLSPT